MTSKRLRSTRAALGMTSHAFAEVVGVSVSTLYRWEATAGMFKPDPLQASLLAALAEELESLSADSCRAIGEKLTDTLIAKGALAALGELIRRVV